jgi:hypothetical protein
MTPEIEAEMVKVIGGLAVPLADLVAAAYKAGYTQCLADSKGSQS